MYGELKALVPYEYNKCSTVDLKEITTNHVYDAKLVGRWLFVLVNDGGKIHLHKYYFDTTFTNYEHKVDNDVNFRNINATITTNGMVVMNTEDDKVELFFDFKRGTKVIDQSPINNQLKLVEGKNVGFIDDGKIYSMRMQ